MKWVSHSELHDEWMRDPEYRAAYEEEMRKEHLRAVLAQWRSKENLTSAEVAARMGIKPPTVHKMEKNILRASIDTLYRYAKACGIEHPEVPLY